MSPLDRHLGLLPAPTHVEPGPRAGTWTMPPSAKVAAHPDLAPAVRWWARVTQAASDVDLTLWLATEVPDAAAVRWVLDPALAEAGYALTVAPSSGTAEEGTAQEAAGQEHAGQEHAGPGGIEVRAGGLAGAHAAAQVLRQLAGPAAYRQAPVGPGAPTYPAARIEDSPAHPWRGVLLDVARHYLPKHDVLRFVDLAAMHRLDVVQLHLTDDQGWRMEVRRYPRLTEVGSWRRESAVGTWRAGVFDGRPHGGFYTQDDLREIAAYARERGVLVVPEIDVPGHVEAAVAAYPELSARHALEGPGVRHEVRTTWGVSTDVLDPSEASLAFFRDVLDEVVDVFDPPYVAIGGDEVPIGLWRDNPATVARAAELGLPDVAALHPWFVGRLAEHLVAAGVRPVVWDEAFRLREDGTSLLPPETVVTAWRGWTVGVRAMAAGHDVVMAPEQVLYLDHRGGDSPDEPVPVGFLSTVRDVHGFVPLPDAALAEAGVTRADLTAPGAGHLLGIQAQVWAEHLDSVRRVDYTTFPRLAAAAEVAWCGPGGDLDEFEERLVRDHLPRLDAYGVEYRPPDGPRPWQTRPGVQGFPRDRAAELAAGGLAGVGGWVDGAQGPA